MPHGTQLPAPSGPKSRWLSSTGLTGVLAVHYGAETIGFAWRDDELSTPSVEVWRPLSSRLREVDHPCATSREAAAVVCAWHEAWDAYFNADGPMPSRRGGGEGQ